MLQLPLLADLVWTALILESRILSVLPITVGLIVEWMVLYFGGFGLSWKKAVVVDVVMNAVSSVVGIALIPLLGLAWQFSAGFFIQEVLNTGMFNPVTWIATILLSICATTGVEASVVKWGFRIPLGKKRFGILFAANAVSVGVACASLWLYPPRY